MYPQNNLALTEKSTDHFLFFSTDMTCVPVKSPIFVNAISYQPLVGSGRGSFFSIGIFLQCLWERLQFFFLIFYVDT